MRYGNGAASFVMAGLLATALLAPGVPAAQLPANPVYPDKARLHLYIDPAGQEQPVRTPADWEKRRAHILANLQQVMGPLPPSDGKVPLDVKIEA